MPYIQVRHKVKDYSAWKKVFDGAITMRKANGERAYQILSPEDDPNNLFLLFEWDSYNNAKKFLGSAELKKAMQLSGVIEEPEVRFLKETARGKL